MRRMGIPLPSRVVGWAIWFVFRWSASRRVPSVVVWSAANTARKRPPLGDKSSPVSESFGSSSAKSLRTPTTSFPSRACVRRLFYQPGNAVRYVPSVPQSIPRCGISLVYRQIPIGSLAAKQRVVTACLTRQWWCVGDIHVRFVRSSPRQRERSW